MGVLTPRRRPRRRPARDYPSILTTTDVDDVLGRPDVEAVARRHADLDASCPRRGGASERRQARLRREADRRVGRQRPRSSSSPRRRSRDLTLMVGHTFVYSPPVRKVKADHRQRRARRDPLRHQPARQPRPSPEGRERDLGPRGARPGHPRLLARARCGRATQSVGQRHRPRLACAPSIPDVAFVNLRFPSGVVASIHVSWLSPVKLRRTMVVGSRRCSLYDDTEPWRRSSIFDHGVDFREPTTFDEFQLSYHTGDIVAPRLDTSEPLRIEAEHFLECVESGDQAAHRRCRGPARGARARGGRGIAERRRACPRAGRRRGRDDRRRGGPPVGGRGNERTGLS